jgi:hypothetical protein
MSQSDINERVDSTMITTNTSCFDRNAGIIPSKNETFDRM